MQKFLQRMMLLAALLVLPWAMQAQETIPYTQGFESSSVPTGWLHIGNGSTATSTTYAHGGSKSLRFYGATSDNVEVMPEFDAEISTLEVTLWMRPESFTSTSCGSFDLGYVTDSADATSFVTIESFLYSDFSAFAEISFAAPNAPDGSRFALRHRANSSSWYWFVDDVDVHTIPTCYRPLALAATNVTSTSADIFWNGPSNASSWVVEYNNANFVPGTGVGTTATVSDTVAYLTDLAANTIYHVYVHADCGSGDTSLNAYFSFRTLPGGDHVSTFPYFCDFSDADENANWNMLGTAANQWFIGSATDAGTGDSASLYISNNNGSSNAYSTSNISYAHALRMVDFTAGQYALQYSWKSQGESHSYDFTRVFLIPGNESITEDNVPGGSTNAFSYAAPANWLNLYEENDEVTMAEMSAWSNYQTVFNIPTDGTYYLAFIWANDGGGGDQPPTAIDNITINELTCPQPTGLTATSVSTDEIEITWTPGGEESDWIVTCGEEEGLTNTNSYIFSNLEPNTYYDITVRAVCSAGDSSFVTGNFRVLTLAGEPVSEFPYSHNFSDTIENAMWVRLGTSSNKWMIGTDQNHALPTDEEDAPALGLFISDNGSTCNYNTGSISYAHAYRDLQLEAGQYAISYDWKGVGESHYYDFTRAFLVPASETLTEDEVPGGSTNDFSSAEPANWINLYEQDGYMTMAQQGSWATTNCVATVPTEGVYRLAFIWANDASIGSQPPTAIDNIYISQLTCPQPTNVVVSDVTSDGATISWTAGGMESSWLVAFNGDTIPVTDTAYTLSELNSNTNYTISVLADCGGEYSFATTASFRTDCGDVSLPLNDNFDTYDDTYPSRPLCYYYNYEGDYPYISTQSGSNTLQFAGAASLAIGPLPVSVNTVYVNFDLQKEGATSGSMQVGYVTDLANIASPNVVAVIDPSATGIMGSYEVSFDTVTPVDSAYIVFHQNSTSNIWYYWLDNLEIAVANPCRKPDNFHIVSQISGDSTAVAWNEGDGSAWEIFIDTVGVAPNENNEDQIITGIFDNSYVFTNLQNGGVYDAYVRTVCDDGASYWRGPLTLTPGAFVFPVTGAGSITGCGFTLFDDGGPAGNYSNYCNYTLTVYPSEDSLVVLEGTFTGEGTIDKLTIYDGASISAPQLGVVTGQGTHVGPITSTSGPLTLTFYSDVSVSYEGFELHVSCVPAPECPDVVNVNVASGATSAVITWEPGYGDAPDGYNVRYRAQGEENWNSFTCTETYYVINGLDPTTVYECQVSSSCGSGNSNWIDANFGTRCYAYVDGLTFGTGSSQTTGVPVNTSWGNTFCQSIFTAAELTAAGFTAGPINGIKYTWATGGSNNKEFVIFLGTTSDATLSSCVSLANSTEVYRGVRIAGTDGTVEYNFDIPYVWDGQSNLLLSSFMNQYGGSQTSSGFYGLSSDCGSTRTAYRYQDSNPFTAASAHTSGNSGSSSAYRPNVTFLSCESTVPTCVAPTVATTNITTNSVDVVWGNGLNETSWNVYYKPASQNNYTLAGTTSTAFFSLSNLASGTIYDIQVESNCGSETAVASTQATTLCGELSEFPFTETFDNWGTGTGAMPNCWNILGSYSSYPYISASTGADYDHTSGNGHAVYMYTYMSGSAKTFFQLPPVDSNVAAVNQLQAVFYLNYPSATGYGVIVGVCDDNDINTFVPVDTLLTSQAGVWEEYEVPLDSYTGTGRYITFVGYGTSSYVYPYLDDLTIEFIPTCQRPVDVTVSNATANSIDVAWTERSGASNWLIEYGPRGFTPGTGTFVAANSNPFTLTNLPTSYNGTVYVYSVCSATDSSLQSRRGADFNTAQIPGTLPYAYNFEDPAEWENWQTNSNTTASWYRGTAVAGQGSYSAYVSADAGATYGNYSFSSVANIATYRDIDLGSIDSSYTLTFKARAGGTLSASYDALMVFVVDPSTPVVASNQGIVSPWGSVNDLDILTSVRLDTVWDTYEVPVDNMSGIQRFVFFWFNQNTAASYPFINQPAAIDDITLDYATCVRPTDLQLVSLGQTNATFTWNGPSSASYLVAYRPYPDGTSNTYLNVNTNSVTLTGLTGLTQYAIWVQKICGADSSLFSDGIAFTTSICDNAAIATNYNGLPEAQTNYAPAYAFYNHSFSQTIIDSVDLVNLAGSDISAFAFKPVSANGGTYYNNCEVWLTPTNKTEFDDDYDVVDMDETSVLVYSGNLAYSDNGWQTFEFDTTFNYSGEGNLILTVVRNHGTYTSSYDYFEAVTTSEYKTIYGYNDSYSVDAEDLSGWSGYPYSGLFAAKYQLVSCNSSRCPAPIITSTTGDYASATIDWSSNASNFEVAYKATTDGDWSTSVAVANAYTYTFNGLTPNTDYQFRVRALCDEEEISDWAVANYTTEELPCFAPTNMAVNTTFTSAAFTWTAGGEETHWTVRVWNTTFDTTYAMVSAPSFTANGLTPEVTYNAAVRAMCGTNGEVPSENWSDTISFTTVGCDVVTNVAATVNGSTATITWTPGSNNNGAWEVRYGYEGFTNGEQIADLPATTNSLTINNLQAYRTYDVYVRAKCADGVYSNWSTKISFYVDQVGIHTAESDANVAIYPNPASGSTTISLAGVAGQVSIAIVDMNGRTIRTDNMECDGNCVKTINVDGLAQGAYFVRVTSDNFNAVKKLIVK